MNKKTNSNEIARLTNLVKEVIDSAKDIEEKTGRKLDLDTIIKCKIVIELQDINFNTAQSENRKNHLEELSEGLESL